MDDLHGKPTGLEINDPKLSLNWKNILHIRLLEDIGSSKTSIDLYPIE